MSFKTKQFLEKSCYQKKFSQFFFQIENQLPILDILIPHMTLHLENNITNCTSWPWCLGE